MVDTLAALTVDAQAAASFLEIDSVPTLVGAAVGSRTDYKGSDDSTGGMQPNSAQLQGGGASTCVVGHGAYAERRQQHEIPVRPRW